MQKFHSLFQHIVCDDTANEQSKYVKTLRQRHIKMTIANQRIISNQWIVIGIEWESFAFNGCEIFRQNVRFIWPDKIQWVVPNFNVHFAVVNSCAIVVAAKLFWMSFGDPFICVVARHFIWWRTPKVSWVWCWSCENNGRHEPRCWHLAQEYDQHCTELPFSKVAQCLCYRINTDQARHCPKIEIDQISLRQNNTAELWCTARRTS